MGPIYDYLDGKWLAHALRKPELKRLAMTSAAKAAAEGETVAQAAGVENVEDDERPSRLRLKGWEPSKTACAIVGTELVCAIIVAWVVSASVWIPNHVNQQYTDCVQLYIVYSLGT